MLPLSHTPSPPFTHDSSTPLRSAWQLPYLHFFLTFTQSSPPLSPNRTTVTHRRRPPLVSSAPLHLHSSLVPPTTRSVKRLKDTALPCCSVAAAARVGGASLDGERGARRASPSLPLSAFFFFSFCVAPPPSHTHPELSLIFFFWMSPLSSLDVTKPLVWLLSLVPFSPRSAGGHWGDARRSREPVTVHQAGPASARRLADLILQVGRSLLPLPWQSCGWRDSTGEGQRVDDVHPTGLDGVGRRGLRRISVVF